MDGVSEKIENDSKIGQSKTFEEKVLLKDK